MLTALALVGCGSKWKNMSNQELAAKLLQRNQSVLDFVNDDISKFKRRLNAEDGENLDIIAHELLTAINRVPELRRSHESYAEDIRDGNIVVDNAASAANPADSKKIMA